ncbi:hypothetical protein Tco_0536837 [Tanacetum coccineum]
MLASNHHKPLLVATMVLRKGRTTAAAAGFASHTPNDLVAGNERSISRIKSSSRHEVTIPILVFRCSDFGGVTERPEYIGKAYAFPIFSRGFQQRFDETFYEAWDRFNDLLRACSELHQLDTFYNALNSNDQDSLNSAAGGNDKYGYIKNHKKTVKNGQTQTRESEEYKRSQRFKASVKERRIREMSQSLSSNVPDNSPEQEAATGHSIPRRIDSPTSQATQLPELGLTLTPATGREHSQEMNKPSAHALRSQVPGPSRKRSRSPSSPFFPDAITYSDGKPASDASELNPEDVTARLEDLEVEIDTLHADTEDKELLISELQDSLAAAESEIAILQIRVADTESRRAEDHEQIQKILTRLSL